jgi:hypothetical protein
LSYFCLSLLASWFKSHLEGVRLDDQKRIGLVKGYFNLFPGDRVYLSLEIESPHQSTAARDGLIASEGHAETLTLPPTEGRHTSDGGKLGQRTLECRPIGFKPSLGSERLWIRVLHRVAEKGIVKRQNASALGYEISSIPVIGFALMGNTCKVVSSAQYLWRERLTSRYRGLPPHRLFDARAQDWKVGHVGNCRGTILADSIDLVLAFALPLRMVDHTDQEIVNGSCYCKDTNECHHTKDARGFVIARNVALLCSLEVCLREAGLLLPLLHLASSFDKALHKKLLLLVMSLALTNFPGVDELRDPVPEGCQYIGNRTSWRHLCEKTPGAWGERNTDAMVVPGQRSHNLGTHVFEGECKIVWIFDETLQPPLLLMLHDAVVSGICRFGQVRVCELALTSPVLCMILNKPSFRVALSTYDSCP